MWVVARKFEFQTFNFVDAQGKGTFSSDGEGVRCVPATAFVAADHLCQLLVTDALPREVHDLGSADGLKPFGRAVWRLHCAIFKPFKDWCRHQGSLETWPGDQWAQTSQLNIDAVQSIAAGLLDLCLYFGMWTEAANLRHMPETLWFLFWVMRQSTQFQRLWTLAVSDGSLFEDPFKLDGVEALMTAREGIRNALRAEIHAGRRHQSQMRVTNGGDKWPEGALDALPNGEHFNVPSASRGVQHEVDRMLPSLPAEVARLLPSTSRLSVSSIVLDLVVFGDGGGFTDHIVVPVFQALAFEVSCKGEAGVEPALRITYDDANESFVQPANVQKILADLSEDSRSFPPSRDTACSLFSSLWKLSSDKNNAPGSDPSEANGEGGGEFDPSGARDRYIAASKVAWYKKTWQERRTWLALYRAYYRVIAFHIIWFHVLLGIAFAEDDETLSGNNFHGRWWVGASGAIVTHLVLQVDYAWSSVFVLWTVPRPPAANAAQHTRVKRVGSVRACCCAACCCCCPMLCRSCVGATRNLELVEMEQQPMVGSSAAAEQGLMWRVARTSWKRALLRRIIVLLFWLVLLVLVTLLFVAEFAWFPWETLVHGTPPDGGGGNAAPPEAATTAGMMMGANADADEGTNICTDDTSSLTGNGKFICGLTSNKDPQVYFRNAWNAFAPAYVGVAVIIWLLAQRDGYVPTLESLQNSAIRWCTCLCGMKVARTEAYISKRPHVGWAQFLRNVFFWALVIAMKVGLDYFVIVRRLPEPVKVLLESEWLDTCGADKKIGRTDVPCVENCILVIAFCLPVLLVIIFDTGILYQIGVFLYGCANGLFVLHLGQVVSWDDLIKSFETGAESVRTHLMSVYTETEEPVAAAEDKTRSGPGAASDRSTAAAARYSPQRRSRWTPFDEIWNSIVDDLRGGDLISNAEAYNLRFQQLALASSGVYQLEPVALPPCFSAGRIQAAVDPSPSESNDVLRDLWRMFLVLLCEIGFIAPDAYCGGAQSPDSGAALGGGGGGDGSGGGGGMCRPGLEDMEFLRKPQGSYHSGVREKLVATIKGFVQDLEALSAATDREHVERLIGDIVNGFKGMCDGALIELQYVCAATGRSTRKQAIWYKDILAAALSSPTPTRDQAQSGPEAPKPKAHTVLKGVHCNDGTGFELVPDSKLDKLLHQMAQLAAEEDDSATFREVPPPEAHRLRNHALRQEAEAARELVKLLARTLSMTDQEAQPRNAEAQRVLKFFLSSLCKPTMPRARPVALMRSMTTLVPHFKEGVLYALDRYAVHDRLSQMPKRGQMDDLVSPMAGFEMSTLEFLFLRLSFPDEWLNFVERMLDEHFSGDPMGREEWSGREAEITERAFLKQYVDSEAREERGLFGRCRGGDGRARLALARAWLMRWASERGQLLARTVKGMMMYEDALVKLQHLEHRLEQSASMTVTLEAPARAAFKAQAESKYRLVVSSQVYGTLKQSKDVKDRWLAAAVDDLMQRFPAFRVAYIDSVPGPGGVVHNASVLLRWDDARQRVVDVYRVRLPWQQQNGRGVLLGEGKPENQNHAMIFCFGEAVQTVDMNQENRLAEAFKMRNLLGEFDPPQTRRRRAKVLAPEDTTVDAVHKKLLANADRQRIVSLVGFREWIFSGKSGALGQFAAGAEFSFGTIVQRTMAEPGGIRFHYGHPDVWNKLFTMTRGGVSKATRAFHVSEDVFGGYNAIFRGSIIRFREYISVGKGRDVGFDQINEFEAKVSGGNGEQAISRDIYRLGTRLDWFRLMSWYHSGIGYFINTTLTMASVYLAVWLVFVFALSDNLTGRHSDDARAEVALGDRDIVRILYTVQTFQLVLLPVTLIPYWGELCLETGFLSGTGMILRQMLAGAPLFFIFRQQTSAHYFSNVATYGGAQYIPTGRGFALLHTPYVKLFKYYGRSHIYFGMQLASLAIMLAFLEIEDYFLSTFATWLVAISLCFSPFWFNPNTFKIDIVQADFAAFNAWMSGSSDMSTKETWRTFHRKQLEKPRNTSGKQTDHGWNRLGGVLLQVFNAFVLVAIGEHLFSKEYDEDGEEDKDAYDLKVRGIITFEVVVVFLVVFAALQSVCLRRSQTNVRRILAVVTGLALLTVFVLYLALFGSDASAGFRDYVLLAYGNFVAGTIAVQLLLHIAPSHPASVFVVDSGYYVTDVIVSIVLFIVVGVLSVSPLVDSIQAMLLFNNELLQAARAGQQLKAFRAKRGLAFSMSHKQGYDGAMTLPLTIALSREPSGSSVTQGSLGQRGSRRYPEPVLEEESSATVLRTGGGAGVPLPPRTESSKSAKRA